MDVCGVQLQSGRRYTAADVWEGLHAKAISSSATPLQRCLFGASEPPPLHRAFLEETPRSLNIREHVLRTLCANVEAVKSELHAAVCRNALNEIFLSAPRTNNMSMVSTGQLPCVTFFGCPNEGELGDMLASIERQLLHTVSPLTVRVSASNMEDTGETIRSLLRALVQSDALARARISSSNPLVQAELAHELVTALAAKYIPQAAAAGGAEVASASLRRWYADRSVAMAKLAGPGIENVCNPYAPGREPVVLVLGDLSELAEEYRDSLLSTLQHACAPDIAPGLHSMSLCLVCGTTSLRDAWQVSLGSSMDKLAVQALYLPFGKSVRTALLDSCTVQGSIPLFLPAPTCGFISNHCESYGEDGPHMTALLLMGAASLHVDCGPAELRRTGFDIMPIEADSVLAGGGRRGGLASSATLCSVPVGKSRARDRSPPLLDPKDVPLPSTLWLTKFPSSSSSGSAPDSVVVTPRLAALLVPTEQWAAGFAKQAQTAEELEDRASRMRSVSCAASKAGCTPVSFSLCQPALSPLWAVCTRVAAWLPEDTVDYVVGSVPSFTKAMGNGSVTGWAKRHGLPLADDAGRTPKHPSVNDSTLSPSPRAGAGVGSSASAVPGEGGQGEKEGDTAALPRAVRDLEVWFLDKKEAVHGGIADCDATVTGIPAIDAPLARNPISKRWEPLVPYPWAERVQEIGAEYALARERSAIAACLFRAAQYRLAWPVTGACVLAISSKSIISSIGGGGGATGASKGRIVTISVAALRKLYPDCVGTSTDAEAARVTRLAGLRSAVCSCTHEQLYTMVAAVVETLAHGGGPSLVPGAGVVPGVDQSATVSDPACSAGLPSWAWAIHPAALFYGQLHAGRDILARLAMPSGFGQPASVSKPVVVKQSAEQRRRAALTAASLSGPTGTGNGASLTAAREAVADWVEGLAQDLCLRPPSTLPLHEAFVLSASMASNLQRIYASSSRTAVYSMLTRPWDLIPSWPNKPRGRQGEDDLHPALPDMVIAFRTCAGLRGRLVPMASWWSAFRAVHLGDEYEAAARTVKAADHKARVGAGTEIQAAREAGAGAFALLPVNDEDEEDGAHFVRKRRRLGAAPVDDTQQPDEDEALQAAMEPLLSPPDTPGVNATGLERIVEQDEAMQGVEGEGAIVQGQHGKRGKGRPKGSPSLKRGAGAGIAAEHQHVSAAEQAIADRFWAAFAQLEGQAVIRRVRRGGSEYVEKCLFDVVTW